MPDPTDDDGVLRIEACGLCGTDHEQFTGHLRAPYAFVPGHEVVGVVERAGATALARWGVHIGQRVAVEVFMSCRSCSACSSGSYRRCARHGLTDMYGFIDVTKAPGLWGGYATHLYLDPDALVLPVPGGLDPVVATLFNPLGAGLRWAGEVPGTTAGDVVVVLGPGIRGLAACAAAKAAGAGFVMVTGLGPADASRLALAPRFGADLAVDVARFDPLEALRTATGAPADVVVDVTAKAPAAPGQALRLVRPGGTVVLAGTRGGLGTAEGFDPDLIVFNEIRVMGALGVDAPAYGTALEILGAGAYPFAELPRQVVGFAGLPSLLEAMAGHWGDDRPVHAVFVPDGGP
ncbi:MAG TPA: medium chain dehydrogenase/reductase family protein [Acidimicrobiales bacterium]|nr:medium chain dehydrogenase/reductase family protein [Acidimicrobiales bacterium]